MTHVSMLGVAMPVRVKRSVDVLGTDSSTGERGSSRLRARLRRAPHPRSIAFKRVEIARFEHWER